MPGTPLNASKNSVIAVFGGGFNPPHVGHAMIASWIKLTGRADEVWFVPSADHPFGKEMASFDFRLKMCQAMAAELGPWAFVTAAEFGLPKPNYTINLLRYLRPLLPTHPLRVVMGVDNLLAREKWFGFADIEAEFDPIYVDRAGIEHDLVLDSPKFPEVSSTEVRRRIVEGLPVDHLVTKAVLQVLKPEGAGRATPG